MPTQLEAFRAWLTYRRAPERTAPERQRAVGAMREILGMAQNGPPDGGSDGSFSREAWEVGSDIVASITLIERTEGVIQDLSARFMAGDFQEPKPLFRIPPPEGRRIIGTGTQAGDAQADGWIDDDLPF